MAREQFFTAQNGAIKIAGETSGGGANVVVTGFSISNDYTNKAILLVWDRNNQAGTLQRFDCEPNTVLGNAPGTFVFHQFTTPLAWADMAYQFAT